MGEVTRRSLLAGAAALGGTAAAVAAPGTASAGQAAAPPAAPAAPPAAPAAPAAGRPPGQGLVTVGPEDPRYPSLTRRGTNARFTGKPARVHVVNTTEQVVTAVQQAVRDGRRIAVRSGGHCFENFVDDPSVGVLIDTSPMRAIRYDAARRAFAVEPGALLGEVYRALFLGWGVSIPAGATAEVGVGGHVLGGGYGTLSRRYGLSVDHLYAVEVVVVDRSGTARSVVATRDPEDPHHDLWWAHTGGGGGNFGIVTCYWFRDPAAKGDDPAQLLPKAPGTVLSSYAVWDWKNLDERAFTRLLRNHGSWYEHNSAPDSPYAGLFSVLMVNARGSGDILLTGQLDAATPGAERLMQAYVDAVGRGVGARPVSGHEETPWLQAVASVQETAPAAFKSKAGYLRNRFTDEQIGAAYTYLAGGAGGAGKEASAGGALWLVSYGGQVNAVAPDATAVPQRDSILKAIYLTSWEAGEAGAPRLAWVRDLYRAVYADSGGVPVPGEVSDGAFVNYPDVDLADPALNTSGVPWHTLYYKGNYPRLQRVKARWDPRDEFRHALSIRPSR
ncbi:FAD-linked oxidase [Streptomyces sp. CB02923]|uniref:FAD-binding oxidoreductase n=1 Tax=Streptomyces sp. CB02923 TaxID=1718985 RepID=UPI00093A4FC0|nr:FAD-binding protein [Streptomyces sp. CB02923]OKI09187.1 FAD-linked oxidase [Streptomyces sp. CB02923]